jgi:hypothetical protein
MMATNALLFIDATHYLKLYGLVTRKRLLDSFEEQQDHIFITKQIVDEVTRNKLHCALMFMLDKFKELEATNYVVPDHLFGISDETLEGFRNSLEEAKKVKTALNDMAAEALTQSWESETSHGRRGRSEFQVSLKLGPTPKPPQYDHLLVLALPPDMRQALPFVHRLLLPALRGLP